MFTKLSNSWELVKASWQVLLADKELLIFPIVSFVASLVVIATFAVPTIFAGVFDGVTGILGLGAKTMLGNECLILSVLIISLIIVVEEGWLPTTDGLLGRILGHECLRGRHDGDLDDFVDDAKPTPA